MTTKNPISFKVILIVSFVALLLIGIYLIVPKNYQIDCRLDATEMDNGSGANQKQTTLAITGVYHQSLFGGDSFTGHVEIDGYPVTHGEMMPITFSSDDKGYGGLSYRNDGVLEFIGYIYMDRKVSEVIICLFDDIGEGRKGWSVTTGSVIAFPYENIDDLADRLY